ncbi:MAG: hypothetical protein KGS61_21300 [Verrucomicrobia bacterium]|nr:hypothetical protein [Verrucomicrobiota bacterium]
MKTNRLLLGIAIFQVTAAYADLLLDETFSYPDGPLVGAGGSPWLHHSGSVTGEVDVVANRLFLTQTEAEDVHAPLAGAPYSLSHPATLYAGFSVNFRSLPTRAGTYFAHFKDAASGFRGRVFAGTNNAAAGCFRLAVANAATDPTLAAELPTDLSLNTDYRVVLRYDVANGASVLWLNPASESEVPVVAGDTPGTNSIFSFAFRQSLSSGSGMGELFVANLRVATTFAEVLPPAPVTTPISLSAAWTEAGLQLTLTGQAGCLYMIETSPDLSTWTLLDTLATFDVTTVFTDSATVGTGARFYRVRLLE